MKADPKSESARALTGDAGGNTRTDNSTPILALRPREAAASIGVSLRTLDRMISEGRICTFKLGPSKGCARLIPVSELQRFLAEHLAGVKQSHHEPHE